MGQQIQTPFDDLLVLAVFIAAWLAFAFIVGTAIGRRLKRNRELELADALIASNAASSSSRRRWADYDPGPLEIHGRRRHLEYDRADRIIRGEIPVRSHDDGVAAVLAALADPPAFRLTFDDRQADIDARVAEELAQEAEEHGQW